MSKSNFQKLYELDVNHKTESKQGLKYLSWAFAWAEFKRVNPCATYSVDQYDGKPYLDDKELGYLVSTNVTVDGLSLPMQLPVMDNKNKAMKSVPYQYKTRNGVKDVEAATMFDVNTAIMRCLVKNLAMHGLGLYIYAGEDIPSADPDEPTGNDRAWLEIVKADPEAIDQIEDPVYKARIELFIKEGR